MITRRSINKAHRLVRMLGKREDMPLEMHEGLIKLKFCTGNVTGL